MAKDTEPYTSISQLEYLETTAIKSCNVKAQISPIVSETLKKGSGSPHLSYILCKIANELKNAFITHLQCLVPFLSLV